MLLYHSVLERVFVVMLSPAFIYLIKVQLRFWLYWVTAFNFCEAHFLKTLLYQFSDVTNTWFSTWLILILLNEFRHVYSGLYLSKLNWVISKIWGFPRRTPLEPRILSLNFVFKIRIKFWRQEEWWRVVALWNSSGGLDNFLDSSRATYMRFVATSLWYPHLLRISFHFKVRSM